MRISRQPRTAKLKWLRTTQYEGFVEALVSKYTNNSDLDVDALAIEIDAFAGGKTTSKGKLVYVGSLLGTLKGAYGQEVVEAIQQLREPAKAKGLDDF